MRRASLTALGVGTALVTAPTLALRVAMASRIHGVASTDVRPAQAALVLGARVWPDGRPSRFLRERVEAGAALWHRGLVERVVVSGSGHNREGLDETAAMLRTAIAAGVPATVIDVDPQGHDSRASALNAAAAGHESVIVCSQEFHLPRSVWLCLRAGLDAQGVHLPVLIRKHTALGYAREAAATWKALLEESALVARVRDLSN